MNNSQGVMNGVSIQKAPEPVPGVYELIGTAHENLSILQKAVSDLEGRLGVVLRVPYPTLGEQANGCNEVSSDSAAIESMRGLINRLAETTLSVHALQDRVQV